MAEKDNSVVYSYLSWIQGKPELERFNHDDDVIVLRENSVYWLTAYRKDDVQQWLLTHTDSENAPVPIEWIDKVESYCPIKLVCTSEETFDKMKNQIRTGYSMARTAHENLQKRRDSMKPDDPDYHDVAMAYDDSFIAINLILNAFYLLARNKGVFNKYKVWNS